MPLRLEEPRSRPAPGPLGRSRIAPDRVPADSGSMPTWQFYVNVAPTAFSRFTSGP